MIDVILDIREMYELDSLIGRDLARTHDHLMDMIDADFQDFMDVIASSMNRNEGTHDEEHEDDDSSTGPPGQDMSDVGLAKERAKYDDDTFFGEISDWLEDLCSNDGEGDMTILTGTAFPTQLMTTTESKTGTTKIPTTRTYPFFLKTKSGCCPTALRESWPMNSCTSGLSTT